MTSFEMHFVTNAGVKDILGQGLIYSDSVAIIELIKNSKDSRSKEAVIKFVGYEDEISNFSTIVISDRGCGMTLSGIENKWLNIAYSEKRNSEQVYAGSKGVGRLSCDRLGERLTLYTKSKSGQYIKLFIDWTDFENKGMYDEISSIPIIADKLTRKEFTEAIEDEDFETGTVLVVEQLRQQWDERKIKDLIRELEKFSPSLEQEFNVYLYSDKLFSGIKSKLNKKIDNAILNKIGFKTTHIKSRINKNGSSLTTELYFHNERVYRYKAKNPYPHLKNLSLEVHFLDPIAKSYFTKNIGVSPNAYGSIFLFYNGFRISPYGNEKNDWLGLDQRKQQGTSRNLGTRELFGRIDIADRDQTFSVITSREGLVNNAAYHELVSHEVDNKVRLSNGKDEYGFVNAIIRQLEAFVVTGLMWNSLIDSLGVKKNISGSDVIKDPARFGIGSLDSSKVQHVLDRMLKSNFAITTFDINANLISDIERINQEKYQKFLSDFVGSTGHKTIKELAVSEKTKLKKLISTFEDRSKVYKDEAEASLMYASEIDEKLEVARGANKYLRKSKSISKDSQGFIHSIKINVVEVSAGLENIIEELLGDEFCKEDIIRRLQRLKGKADSTIMYSKLATLSDFGEEVEKLDLDFKAYFEEYLGAVKAEKHIGEKASSFGFEIVSQQQNILREIDVVGLSIVIDNLMSNSLKWGSKYIVVELEKSLKGVITIIFKDNGEGLSSEFLENPEEIFELGVRSQKYKNIDGSGIGLYAAKECLVNMGGGIVYSGSGIDGAGSSFTITLK